MLKTMIGRRWIVASLLVIAGAMLCIRLGIWQLDRLEQRRTFNTHYLAARSMSELDLNTDENSDLLSMEYRSVTAKGIYDFTNQVALLNFYNNSEYGYHLLTPMRLDDGRAVLVERGWIPADGNGSREGWSRYDEGGEMVIKGVIRLGVSRVPFGGRADPTPGPGQSRLDYWNFVNIDRIAAQIPYPILSVYIQLMNDPNDVTPPIPAAVDVEVTEGPHLGYAIQWFTFAAILLVGYPFFVNRQESSVK